jgi:hypothetical protein
MLGKLQQWFTQLQINHGVNPIIFAIIYFAGVIPFWLAIYKIIGGLKNKNLFQVRTFGIILGIVIIAPFIYVALFGRNLPFSFWIIAALLVGYSTYAVMRRIKSAHTKGA